jgi:hypothetical protein
LPVAKPLSILVDDLPNEACTILLGESRAGPPERRLQEHFAYRGK